MALKRIPHTLPFFQAKTKERVGRRGGFDKGCGRSQLEKPLVQILVEVATTQVEPLWTEVEKGFLGSAMRQE